MNLLDYQRAFAAYLFGRSAQATALGDPGRLALYRGMAQRRTLAQARTAYPAAYAQLGEARFAELLIAYVREQPPRSRAFRDAVADFGAYALRALAQLGDAPWLGPLFALEGALFRAAYTARPPADVPAPLAFDAPPLFTVPLWVVRAAYPVHRLLAADAPRVLPPEPTVLWVYRDADDVVRFRTVDPLLARVGELADQTRDASLVELVRRAADEGGRAVDEALLEVLADGVTGALAAGVLRGSLPR